MNMKVCPFCYCPYTGSHIRVRSREIRAGRKPQPDRSPTTTLGSSTTTSMFSGFDGEFMHGAKRSREIRYVFGIVPVKDHDHGLGSAHRALYDRPTSFGAKMATW